MIRCSDLLAHPSPDPSPPPPHNVSSVDVPYFRRLSILRPGRPPALLPAAAGVPVLSREPLVHRISLLNLAQHLPVAGRPLLILAHGHLLAHPRLVLGQRSLPRLRLGRRSRFIAPGSTSLLRTHAPRLLLPRCRPRQLRRLSLGAEGPILLSHPSLDPVLLLGWRLARVGHAGRRARARAARGQARARDAKRDARTRREQRGAQQQRARRHR